MIPDPEKKLAGVLAPVFSLRGECDLGIGDVGALRELVHWSVRHGIRAVQILPVNEPGGDHSPYNLLSAMALDPLTIETVPGSLPGLDAGAFDAVLKEHPPQTEGPVNYAATSTLKIALLEAAFKDFAKKRRSREWQVFSGFAEANGAWLEDYALHRELVAWHGGSEVSDHWPQEHLSPSAAREWLAGLPDRKRRDFQRRMLFRKYIQWVAHSQWMGLREEADAAGVALIGDVPVGVSRFSTDVWAHPQYFDLSRSSGAPPERVFKADAFTARWGQNWGFPLYDWLGMSHDNFHWWRHRLRALLGIFHLLRVDHALGFFRIYSFPWRPEDNERFTHLSDEEAAAITGGPLPGFVDRNDDTDENREHNRRHGEMVFGIFCEEAAPHRLLAEDLGEVAPYVRPTLEKFGIPGFKIPQWEREGDRFVTGDTYRRLSLATFGTHDHPPIRAFWEDLCVQAHAEPGGDAAREQARFMEFCQTPGIPLPQPFTPEIHRAFLGGLLRSNSWLAVHMLTDLFGSDARFNVPGTSGAGNWTTRLPAPISHWDDLHGEILACFSEAIRETGRDLTP
jgi:4-alpha-glucanotransferase